AFERYAQAPPSHLRSVFPQPSVMNRENVIRDPRHVRLISRKEPFHFIHNSQRIPSPVRHPKHLVATPPAAVRASSSGDKRKRTLPMSVAPCLQVAPDVHALPRRPRLCVNIRDLCTLPSPPHPPAFYSIS